MWYGHLRCITAGKILFNLLNKVTKPAQAALFGVVSETLELQKSKIDEILELQVIETKQTERAATIIFAKKDETLQFRDNFQKLDTVT